MKVFLTGGSGFVGQNLIPQLKEAGHEVLALTRSDRSAQVVTDLGAIPVMDDLVKLSQHTAKALRSCDAVVHSAAYMDFTYDKETFYQLNVEATRKLLDFAVNAGTQAFIYISAAPVVPGSPVVQMTEANAGTELPRDLYPLTKALGERLVLEANSSALRTISLRPPLIWGPNNHHMEEMMDMAKSGKWRWIGGGAHVLSTIHVQNLGAAVLAALDSDKGGEAYFVTDGEQRTLKDFMTEVMKAQGVDPGNKSFPVGVASTLAKLLEGIWKLLGRQSRPPIAPIMIRLMGREFSVIDDKARRELGYENVLSIDQGIDELAKKGPVPVGLGH